jgi:hypothetical protein
MDDEALSPLNDACGKVPPMTHSSRFHHRATRPRLLRGLAITAALVVAVSLPTGGEAQAQSCDPLSPDRCPLPGWDDPYQQSCAFWNGQVMLAPPYPCIPYLGPGGP